MSDELPSDLADLIISILGAFPDGASTAQLCAGVNPRPSERTMARWLSALCAAKRVEQIGQGPTTRYRQLADGATAANGGSTTGVAAPPSVSEPGAVRADSSSSTITSTRKSTIEKQDAEEDGTTSETDFTRMLALALPQIVWAEMTAPAAQYTLQAQAMAANKSLPEVKQYMEYAKARLAALTPEDAADAYGIEREKYDAWRANYAGWKSTRRPKG